MWSRGAAVPPAFEGLVRGGGGGGGEPFGEARGVLGVRRAVEIAIGMAVAQRGGVLRVGGGRGGGWGMSGGARPGGVHSQTTQQHHAVDPPCHNDHRNTTDVLPRHRQHNGRGDAQQRPFSELSIRQQRCRSVNLSACLQSERLEDLTFGCGTLCPQRLQQNSSLAEALLCFPPLQTR